MTDHLQLLQIVNTASCFKRFYNGSLLQSSQYTCVKQRSYYLLFTNFCYIVFGHLYFQIYYLLLNSCGIQHAPITFSDVREKSTVIQAFFKIYICCTADFKIRKTLQLCIRCSVYIDSVTILISHFLYHISILFFSDERFYRLIFWSVTNDLVTIQMMM